MSGLYDNTEEMTAAMEAFFQGHPDLPKLPEVWDQIGAYIWDRQLSPSLANFEFAYQAVRKEVEEAINLIPANEWKQRVVIPAFEARQASTPEPPPSEKPWGVSWSQFLHSR